jgi:hypothetical protein
MIKRFSFLFATVVTVVMVAVPVLAEYYTTAKAVKQADGTYDAVFPINDWPANPEAVSKDPAMANKTTTFGKDVTVCVALFAKGKQVRQGNNMLVTKTDWSRYQAVGKLAIIPDGVDEILMWCLAPAGESKGTNGCMMLNQKDPSYTPEGYRIKIR